MGGPIGLLQDGDVIVIDAEAGGDGRGAERGEETPTGAAQAWQPREHDHQSGVLWKFAQNVGDAEKGAVTHPGGKAEVQCYADI